MEVENSAENEIEHGELWRVLKEIMSTCKNFHGTLEKLNSFSNINNKGLSILNVKADTMFTYLNNLFHNVLMKCSGQSLNYATRERLAEVRVILEKIKPLELKLKYQIEKHLKLINSKGKNDILDKSNFRAKIDDLESAVESDDEETNEPRFDSSEITNSRSKSENVNGVYKPPKLVAVPYDDGNKEEKHRKKIEHSKKRALTSSIMQELKEEYLDTPLEISNANSLRNKRTNYKQERESYEETYFTRLPTTKKERHRDKLMSTLTVAGLGNEVTRFEDISALDEKEGRNLKKRMKTPHMKIKRIKKSSGKNVFKKRKIH